MTIREHLLVLRDSWKLIVGVTLAGVLVAGVVTLLTPATYSAAVTFYISTQSTSSSSTDAYQGSLLSQERVKSYTALLSGYRLANEVDSDLQLGEDPNDIAEDISASVSPDTVLLTAEVLDRSPQRAEQIAGAVGRTFPRLVATLEQPADRALPPPVTAQLVQGPLLAEKPVSPRPVLFLVLGLIAGLLAGVTVAVVRRSLDRTIRNAGQLAHVFPKPLLGAVETDPEITTTPLFLRDRPQSAAAENIRAVRTNFDMLNFGQHASRCYVVTSSVEGEGKSTVAVNLALAEARSGRRVLVIEADLRRPRAATYLGLPGAAGLTQLVSGRVRFTDVVQGTGTSRLDLLAAGSLPPNPLEMLESEQMRAVLRDARNRYDTVLLDAPPLVPVADGLALSKLGDGVLCVVRARVAPLESISRAREILSSAGLTNIGLVLNGVAPGESGYTGYYAARADPGPAPDLEATAGLHARPPSGSRAHARTRN
ncbi:capsular exopolysaccharide synthesis family protein [Pseudonocardia sediminis]|uniref:Capsular exopolysaccharide synthesis family protein n=1 Tax=Pseudonocardia sediminis TaxID=1397368 RepID=A0A4Q7V0S6_PSEST|nr:polysaccharide biosynthesis tyrosine autokinase [Pseudonocardia sediminis]RZT87896.1 capsular exopolysaccharide synthesis family protein [Pseudonocardia sediminis]